MPKSIKEFKKKKKNPPLVPETMISGLCACFSIAQGYHGLPTYIYLLKSAQCGCRKCKNFLMVNFIMAHIKQVLAPIGIRAKEPSP